jgi:thioredoxin-like negative regulator of GroEL
MTCAKVNADRAPELGRRYQIRGLPTILFLDRHGIEINRVTGFVEAQPFANAMDAVLAAADRLAERTAALAEDSENPALIYALADEYLAQEQYAAAEPLLASLTPAGPHAGSTYEADAVVDLAIARGGRGDRAAARKILAGFLKTYPQAARRNEAELRLGQLLLAAGETEAARQHLETVARDEGSNPWKAGEARRLLALASGSP